jgi:signal transduction histidine kinase
MLDPITPSLTSPSLTSPAPINLSPSAPLTTDPHLRLISQRQPIVLFTLDASGKFLSLEGRGCVQMGIDPGQVLMSSTDIETLFAESSGLITRLKQAMVHSQESRWNCEVRGYVWEFCCEPLVDSEGRMAGLNGFALDITQRRHIESELRWKSHALTALNLIASAVTSTRDLPHILATLQDQLAVHLHILGGAVYLRDRDQNRLYCHSAWSVSPELIERTTDGIASAERGVIKALNGEAYHLEEIFQGPEVSREVWQGAICIPLIANGKDSGRLVLYSSEPLTFRKHRPTFFEMLGCQVGAVLQNAQVFQDMLDGRVELQNLAHRVVFAQELERSHIARELHDEFGQILTCLKLCLENAEHPAVSPDAALSLRAQSKLLADDMLSRVRNMALELRSPDLDGLGLIPTLQQYIDGYAAQTGILVHLHCGFGAEARFGEPVETAVYRIVQEALTNVARHAEALEAHVTLTKVSTDAEGPSLNIYIEDYGNGFDTNERRQTASCGLAGMRERAIALRGGLQIKSFPGRGTRIEAHLPFEDIP